MLYRWNRGPSSDEVVDLLGMLMDLVELFELLLLGVEVYHVFGGFCQVGSAHRRR